ncbi:MAG: hypothetical protein J4F36_03790 [Nitrosopumilaceae archaeon]|nr:hypothetical protein [Nitrosopumilaceae archaeon]
MKIEANEITEFVNAVKNGISKSEETGNFQLMTNIDFELSVITKKSAGGKVNIAIARAGGDYENQAISKVRFTMGNQATIDKGIESLIKAFSGLAEIDKPKRKSLTKSK